MNTVVIDGVTYTKAGTLAKKFRYTTDYIGQLCRAEKVDAQLVGRSWYVSEDSLEAHSSRRIEAIRQDEIALEEKTFSSTDSVVKVSAPLSKITKKMLSSNSSPYLASGHYSVAKYESDSVDLLPVMQIRPEPAKFVANDELAPVSSPDIPKPNPDNSFSVPINQHRPVKIQTAEEVPKSVKPIMVQPVVKNLEIKASKAETPVASPSLASDMASKSVSFTPASVAVNPSSNKSSHRFLTLSLLLLAGGVIFSALLLDLEVYYDGSISSRSFSLNQTALLYFFK